MDFFVWQGVEGIHSGAMDDGHNAARRKKTRSYGMLCLGIGITCAPLPVRQKGSACTKEKAMRKTISQVAGLPWCSHSPAAEAHVAVSSHFSTRIRTGI
jgi:hypothetical protein